MSFGRKLEIDEHVPQPESAMILAVRRQLTILLPSTSPISPSAALIRSVSASRVKISSRGETPRRSYSKDATNPASTTKARLLTIKHCRTSLDDPKNPAHQMTFDLCQQRW
jgi:hypothetical protein